MSKRALIVLAAALLGAGFAFAALDARAQHVANTATVTIDTSADARVADVVAFRENFMAVDHAYSPAARAEAQRRLTALKNNAGAISQAYFELELSRIVALADNGHTAAFPWPRAARYNRIPLRLAAFGEDFYVVRTPTQNGDLLGARLTAIDGHDIAQLRTASRSLMGGVNGWRDRFANYLFESPEQLHALDLAADAASATYTFQTTNGQSIERRFDGDAVDAAHASANPGRFLYPQTIDGEGEWRALMPAASAPWSMQAPDERFRWRNAPEIDGIVLELRQNNDAANETIAQALTRFERAIADNRPRNLVLDMRMNSGGDLNTTRDFVQSLPARVPGRIFVLTSPWTFSAAISTTGYLKQTAPDRVTIVGEQVGDRLQFFAEGAPETLPNSHLMVLAARERHDYVTGCEGFTDCHGNVVRNPIRVPNLDVQIAAPWTIEAYAAGRDPGMEAIAAVLR
ncbi:S41 family peptidase [Terricaulis silvestris]|uniref:Peptidase family S41 n=1 Tax=Terricaulis silvestris TaxID=2686094 RepID=A0A6I6ML80_9CAUL|nr:hypothetical protein [Terricaulis silvestris]QGZ93936.1 Peptidase family S41 [Terricaulis silvestris]